MPRERKHPGNSSEKNVDDSKKKKYVSTGVSLLKINNPAFQRPVENKENFSPLVKTAKTKNSLKDRLLFSKSAISMNPPKAVVVIDGAPASIVQERLKNHTPVQVRQNTSTSVPVHIVINPVQGKPNTAKTSVVVIEGAPASKFQGRLKTPTPVQVSQNTSTSVPVQYTIKPGQEKLNLTKSAISVQPPKSVVVIDGGPASKFQERLKDPTPVQVSQNTSTSVPIQYTIKPGQEKLDLTKSAISVQPPKLVVVTDGAPASKFQERLNNPPPIQERQHISTSEPVHCTDKSVQETPKITKPGTSVKPPKSLINIPPVPKYLEWRQEKLKKIPQPQERAKNAFAAGHFSRPEKRTKPSNSIQEKQELASPYIKKSKSANSLQERQKSLSIHETPKPTNSSQDRSLLENAANIQNHKTGLKSETPKIESQRTNSMPILINEEVKEKAKNTYSYEERPKANNSSQKRPPPSASYQEKGPKGMATPIDGPKGVAPQIGGTTVSNGHPSKKLELVGVETPLKKDLQGPTKEAVDAREKAQRERKGKYCVLNLLKKCDFENLWTISEICFRNCLQNSKSLHFIKQS